MQLKYKKELYDIECDVKDETATLSLKGEKQQFKSIKLTNNSFAVFLDNTKYISHVAKDSSHYYVNIDGTSFQFDIVDEKEKSYGGDDKSTANKDIIKPPMPGSIVKVLVEQGQKVNDGDGLIIMEAMKMETTIYASISGKVTEVNVKAGEQVDADKVLVVVEREEV
jgi:acetyl/propionyl-CoA carboxylase alpha subunit